MKKLITFFAFGMSFFSAFSQAPEKMSYQAIIRDANSALIANQSVSVRISILKTSTSGTAVYVETHATTTNPNGLITLQIGNGNVVNGVFSTIDWGKDTYFIKTETDPTGATNYSISGTSQLLSVPFALHAKTAQNVPNYKVGDFAHGGIVFWVDETGQHGLVCSLVNLSSSTRWFAGTFGITRAKGDGTFSGKNNTAIIIATQRFLGDDGGSYAATICNEHQVNVNNRNYGGWYLPSKQELNLIFENKAAINLSSKANGGDSLNNNLYWSSTEFSTNNAWAQDMTNGQTNSSLKTFLYEIRAVRSF